MTDTGRAIDPITLSTVWHGFQSVGREMRHVIDRTAQSYLIAQLHDMAAGIHSDLADKLKGARIWGGTVHDGQQVQSSHVLTDKNVVELHF